MLKIVRGLENTEEHSVQCKYLLVEQFCYLLEREGYFYKLKTKTSELSECLLFCLLFFE